MSLLIRSELRKLFTTRSWWGMLIGVVVVSAGLALLLGLVAGGTGSSGSDLSVRDPSTVRSIYTAGIGITYLFSLSAGILAMAGEWRHRTVSATFLATPRRGRVVIAKVAALGVLGGLYGLVSILCGLLVGAPVIAARGGSTRLLTDGVPRACLLGVLAVALWALFGVGIATLIRNQVAALMISVGVAWVVVPLISVLLVNGLHRPGIAAYLPSQATQAMLSADAGGSSDAQLAWWGGALVMVAYAAIFAGIGTALTRRRDVT